MIKCIYICMYLPKCPIDSKSALVQVMVLCWTGEQQINAKPLPEPMMTMIIDAICNHKGNSELTLIGWVHTQNDPYIQEMHLKSGLQFNDIFFGLQCVIWLNQIGNYLSAICISSLFYCFFLFFFQQVSYYVSRKILQHVQGNVTTDFIVNIFFYHIVIYIL